MSDGRYDRGALGFGIFFVVAGTVLLLERVGVLEVEATLLWPVLLIALGLGLLVAGWRRPAR